MLLLAKTDTYDALLLYLVVSRKPRAMKAFGISYQVQCETCLNKRTTVDGEEPNALRYQSETLLNIDN